MSDRGEQYLTRVAASETIKSFGNEAFNAGDFVTANRKYTKVSGSALDRWRSRWLSAWAACRVVLHSCWRNPALDPDGAGAEVPREAVHARGGDVHGGDGAPRAAEAKQRAAAAQPGRGAAQAGRLPRRHRELRRGALALTPTLALTLTLSCIRNPNLSLSPNPNPALILSCIRNPTLLCIRNPNPNPDLSPNPNPNPFMYP